MKIYQIVDTLNFGDAIGNDVVAKKHVIEDMGIETEIYANAVSPKVTEPGAYCLEDMPKVKEDDIVIYHMGNGSPLNHMVTELNCRKIMVYHNITPYEFFGIDNINASENCRVGIEDMKTHMKGRFNAYIADSEFNKSDMLKMGYKESDIEVIPVIVPFDDYKQEPDQSMVNRLSDGSTNIIFVGRIAPNKKHEDIIRAFACYKEKEDPSARLILAGSHNSAGIYYDDIVSYVNHIGVQDVIFPGHITFAEILAIYRTAHVFLCMSEHEGFCVPLLEAMALDVPVIAYNACAVPETIGGASVVVDNKDPVFLSKVIKEVAENKEMRNMIIEAQRNRLKDFSYDKIKVDFQNYIKRFMEKFPPLSPDDSMENYNKLYSLTENNMKASGNEMQFSRKALMLSAERQAENTDVTALLNADYSVREFIEAAYISFFNVLPSEKDYAHWEEVEQRTGRTECMKSFVKFALTSKDRINKGIRIQYNPFASE